MPSVTGKVYNHSKRMKEKRAVLDGVAGDCGGLSVSPQKPDCVWSPDRRQSRNADVSRPVSAKGRAFSFETP